MEEFWEGMLIGGEQGEYDGDHGKLVKDLPKIIEPTEKEAKFWCWNCGSKNYVCYTVKDEIWKMYGSGDKGVLCIPCLEGRMGRRLRFNDFKLDTRIMEMMVLSLGMLGIPKDMLENEDLNIEIDWMSKGEHYLCNYSNEK